MLYLTYDNSQLQDGAGAQLQRILSIYIVAKAFGVGYIHQGLAAMTYQGAKCLENNASDPDQVHRYNSLFHLPSDTPNPPKFDQTFKVFDISEAIINQFKDKPENTLLVIQFAGTMIDANPHLFESILPFPWAKPLRPHAAHNPIIVAVHVRRGELLVVDSHRMLPNSYYVDCIRALHALFTHAGLAHEFHIHTEVLTKSTVITPQHHGICDRTKEPVVVGPEDSHMEDFAGLPNVVLRINEDPVDTLKALCTCDVLLASRSSFSYVAAIVKKGIVLFHPFWHALAPSWIACRSGHDIIAAHEKILTALGTQPTSCTNHDKPGSTASMNLMDAARS